MQERTLAVAGQIVDRENVQALTQEFCPTASGRDWLSLDFSNVRAITASGLGELVTWHTDLRADGGRLTLSHLGEEVYGVFEATRLTDMLDVRPITTLRSSPGPR